MHRSGTSCLAGMLQACGAYLGDVARWSPHNPKGNRELMPVWQLNDDILASNRGSWDAPPDGLQFTYEHRSRRDAILSALAASRAHVVCIKDPRLVLTLDLWLEALPADSVHIVGSVREPAAVARSLEARDGMDHGRALRLWRTYNDRLLALQEQHSGGIVDFSLSQFPYVHQVRALSQRIELTWNDAARQFFDADLRRHLDSHVTVSTEDQGLYWQLRYLASLLTSRVSGRE